jgi:prolyl-tRNA editing enzyme YbaK/EbsC (Cys-tRNA(Pro) deacylase)
MGAFELGRLRSVPASERRTLVAAPTAASLERMGWLDAVGVVEIDPELSDTAKSQEAFQLPPESLANCERLAACIVLFTTRADVNGVVRRHLDVRKASFLSMDRAVELTGMQYGGINPIGLPDGWPILIDRRVAETDIVLIGSGIRGSKLLLPGRLLADLPAAEIIDGLGISTGG